MDSSKFEFPNGHSKNWVKNWIISVTSTLRNAKTSVNLLSGTGHYKNCCHKELCFFEIRNVRTFFLEFVRGGMNNKDTTILFLTYSHLTPLTAISTTLFAGNPAARRLSGRSHRRSSNAFHCSPPHSSPSSST